jgi:putative serine protease PepD
VALAAVALIAVVAVAVVLARRDDDDDKAATGCDATQVAGRALPSVVTLLVESGGGAGAGSGSGEVVRSEGYILTNDHVVSAAAGGGSITVLFSDGTSDQARLVGRDVQTDLAVVKIDHEGSLPPIPFGSSSDVEIGQPVVALGAPLGLASTVTSGIVSGLDRSVNVPADAGQTALIVAAIQTDAAINPGNSGGALVDCSGRLIGVPTAGAVVPNPGGGTSAGNIGIGFAIPSDFARKIGDELIADGRVVHGSFGVRVAATTGAGLFVAGVEPGGPSATAGLREGDVITEIGDEPAVSAQQLQALTLTKQPGQTVKLTFERSGRSTTVDVILGSQA